MRVGSFVFSTDQGLGVLAKSFVDHGIVTDVLVLHHGRRPEHDEWYPGAQRIGNVRGQADEMLRFCRDMDAMLFFETPFHWQFLPILRADGVKTIVMPMCECMPREIPAQPNLWLCPSALDFQWVIKTFKLEMGTGKYKECCYLPVPVNVPWRQRVKVKTFVHNAGWGGLKGRNGTAELLAAILYVQSPAKFIIRSQEMLPCMDLVRPVNGGVEVEFRIGTADHDKLWGEGDCFVFPEKFNGLSLPLQEARAAGMLVMGTDRFPMNEWLPREPLIPVKEYKRSCVSPRCAEFDEAVVDPRDIAAKIDERYEKVIVNYSSAGKRWAEENSWEKLGPRYKQVLEELCA